MMPTDQEIDGLFPFLDNNSNRQQDKIRDKRKGAKKLRDYLQEKAKITAFTEKEVVKLIKYMRVSVLGSLVYHDGSGWWIFTRDEEPRKEHTDIELLKRFLKETK